MKKIFGILLAILILFSCSTRKQNESNKTNETIIDTLVSNGNEVVFFRPTKSELDVLFNEYGKENGINEAESTFDNFVDSISIVYNKWKLIKYPTQRVIKIIAFDKTASYLDRHNVPNMYGVIYNFYSTEPVVEFGMKNNESTKQMLDRLKGK